MSHRKVEREMKRWFGESDPCGEEGAEPKDKAFCLPVDLEYVPALTHDHELWVLALMSFLRGAAVLSLTDRVRNSVYSSCSFGTKGASRCGSGTLSGCLLGANLTLEVFLVRTTGRRPWGRPRTRWRDNVSHLAWRCLGLPLELEHVPGERDDWSALLEPAGEMELMWGWKQTDKQREDLNTNWTNERLRSRSVMSLGWGGTQVS